MTIQYDDLRQAAKRCLITAGSSYTPDRLAAYEKAIAVEKEANPKWYLELILENARIAEQDTFPLCDDTGIPHVLVRLGEECALPAGWMAAIREGIKDGLRALPEISPLMSFPMWRPIWSAPGAMPGTWRPSARKANGASGGRASCGCGRRRG